MLDLLIFFLLGVFSGGFVAINLSERWNRHWIHGIACAVLSTISALFVCTLYAALMFKTGKLELPSPDAGLGELLFNSWAVASGIGLLVVPVVLVIAIWEHRKNHAPESN
jgi:ABC-type Fe3+ transport system permease subunit